MSRLQAAFARLKDAGETALVGYVMAGDPSPEASLAYARAVLSAADVLEIGVPFSDPVADGPVIARAGVRALEAGAGPGDALGLSAHLRRESSKPILLMTYYNPIYKVGPANFAKAARDCGADGLIVPDLPLEESAPLRAACDAHGLDLVLLASPASPPARVEAIAQATRGFLYLVSSYGVTGARGALAETVAPLVQTVKALAKDVPVCVGFGVSSPEDVRALGEAGADGVVVGSHFVRFVEEKRSADELAAEARRLKDATRHASPTS